MGKIVAWARDASSGLFGFISPDGNWVINPRSNLSPEDFHEGLAVFRECDNPTSNERCGFIDANGEVAIPAEYQYLRGRSFFSHGLAVVGDGKSIYAGYIDSCGQWAIGSHFYKPLPFLGAYAPAGNGKTTFGILDKNGNWHVKPRFSWLDNFYDGLACGAERISEDNPNPRSGFFSESGILMIDEPRFGDWPECDSFSEGRAKLTDRRSGLSIYIDKHGFPVSYTEVLVGGYYNEGLAYATDPYTHRDGFLGLDGNWAIPPMFDFTHDFHDGLAAVVPTNSSLWGFINKRGEWAIPPSFMAMRHFGAGFAAVQDVETQMWGVIDKSGRWTAKPQFANIGHFHNTEQ